MINKKVIWSGAFLFLSVVLFSLPFIPASRAAVVADRYIYIAGIGIWGGIAYIIQKQKKWAKLIFVAYLIYLVSMSATESLKWYKAFQSETVSSMY